MTTDTTPMIHHDDGFSHSYALAVQPVPRLPARVLCPASPVRGRAQRRLAEVGALLATYGEVEGTPTDYEFLVAQIRMALTSCPRCSSYENTDGTCADLACRAVNR